MSGHEHERLSAYLDDALPAAERAQVAAHVDACAECAGRLAELAAVDGAVAATPSEPPQGYFEALPARVRSRLEPRAARRLPVWTWAAAAALLLAVVTPLTLLRRPHGFGNPPREIPAAAAPELAKSQAAPAAQAPEPARIEPKAETQAQRPAPALASPAPKRREPGFAAAPSEADARAARVPAAPAVAQPALEAPVASREEEVAAARSDAGAMAEAMAPDARNQAKASGDRRAAESARDAVSPMSGDEDRLARGRVGAPAAGSAASPKLVTAAAEWQRLDAARPRTPAEWRRLREDWRRLLARDPGHPQADEARLRVIEAGREAWRAGGDPADEALFRKDAAEYLTRDDALQKERVQELLRSRD